MMMWKLVEVHNEGFYNSYCASDIIRTNRWRRLRWEGHTAGMRELKNLHSFMEETAGG
jgi:hypothetical protein